MTAPAPQLQPARVVRTLHAVLSLGVVLMTTAFIGLALGLHRAPPLDVPLIGYIMAAMGIVLASLALTVLRPRVPARTRDVTPDAFWAHAPTRGSALLMWAVLEGAGMLGAVGYMITGVSATLAAIAVALIGLAWTRPGQLEQID